MALLDSTHQQYYQSDNHGNYQFVSLNDIINQFMVVYVGEGKIISKASRIDVAFHAQRALAELSFDTFKSVKAQEIVLPPTLQMILPHDYVNYTKISWSDSSGIKHPLYPTKDTSNPFMVSQDDIGNYIFPSSFSLGTNMDFSEDLVAPWFHHSPASYNYDSDGNTPTTDDTITIENGVLTFKQHVHKGYGSNLSKIYACWQGIDVTGVGTLNISATGTSQGSATNVLGGRIRIGVTATNPNNYNPPSFYNKPNIVNDPVDPTDAPFVIPYESSKATSPEMSLTPWLQTLDSVDAYLEWEDGQASTKSLTGENGIDVSQVDKIWIVINSLGKFSTDGSTDSSTFEATSTTNKIDDIILTSEESMSYLSNATTTSTTWSNFKSEKPVENNINDYQDFENNVYWPNEGERYGLEPRLAQTNGTFYIDDVLGKIHFSSNVSGKTVILDYISDSLGTEAEMKVHKLAEDAMYKHILCDLMSGRANVGRGQLQYYKKDKFAAVRKAKLRLSNIKLEELTQILRGKSKWIKH